MTTTADLPPGTGLRLGPDVVRTHLPYGGQVLVNATTLAVLEFGENDGNVVDRLLALGVPPPEAGLAVWRLACDLVDGGWFAATAPKRKATP